MKRVAFLILFVALLGYASGFTIDLSTPPSVIPQTSSVKYEAENAFLTKDEVESSLADCRNTSMRSEASTYASLTPQSTIIFTVNIPEDGDYPVSFRFSSCIASTKIVIHANGLFLLNDELGYSSTWVEKEHLLTLRAGLNTISYLVSSSLFVDSIEIKGALPLAPRGATLSYYEIEAEDAQYKGTLIGPGRAYTTLPSEASGRKAVQLVNSGDYVQFTLTAPAGAIVIRYSIPDSSTGTGLATSLDVNVNNAVFATLNITSLYSWVYGAYPFSKNPRDGSQHHFYDDVRLSFDKTLPTGTPIKLQAHSTSIVVTIDVVDFYTVPAPYPQPGNTISVADYGADPTLTKDNIGPFNQAIAAAVSQGKTLWIPQGRYMFNTPIMKVDKLTVRGAGPWHTELHGYDFGFYANYPPGVSTNIQLYDFAIFGRTRTRIDDEQSTGAGGALSNSVLQNLWIEHNKCGLWLDGPFTNLLITGLTIRNTFADGINFHRGVTNSVVEQTIIRNVGDDALAMWAEQPGPYSKNTFKFNTLQIPILANNIAIYGGSDNSATDNVCIDTIAEGGGLQTGTRFGSVTLGGTTTFARTSLLRTGSPSMYDPSSKGFGQIWLYSDSQPISSPVIFEDITIIDSYYQGVGFYQSSMSQISFNNVTIDTASYALEERVTGSISATYLVAKNLKIGGQWNCGSPFTITQGPGNSGWDSKFCQ